MKGFFLRLNKKNWIHICKKCGTEIKLSRSRRLRVFASIICVVFIIVILNLFDALNITISPLYIIGSFAIVVYTLCFLLSFTCPVCHKFFRGYYVLRDSPEYLKQKSELAPYQKTTVEKTKSPTKKQSKK